MKIKGNYFRDLEFKKSDVDKMLQLENANVLDFTKNELILLLKACIYELEFLGSSKFLKDVLEHYVKNNSLDFYTTKVER